MVHPDDAEVNSVCSAMCYACGQLFCGECVPQLLARVADCPKCRAPFSVSAEGEVERLLRLVNNRTHGRHTPIAQYSLGFMYDNGRGVMQDLTEAARLYTLAAEQGEAAAQSNLGYMCDQGRGVPQDLTEAAKWYRLAAEQGNAKAQFNLGILCDQGAGVLQDYTEAAKWFKHAAEQGYMHAQYNLGVLHVHGQGVPEDFAKAARWFHLAAQQGHVDASKDFVKLLALGTASPR
jgi:TPR repeat protein